MSFLVEHDLHYNEFQHYCNYPEVSKSSERLNLHVEEVSYCDSSSSSDLPSLSSAVSDPSSQSNMYYIHKESSSLFNFCESLLQTESSTDVASDTKEFEIQPSSDEEDSVEHLQRHDQCENDLNYIDPAGWIKYASDPDPWNKKFYTADKPPTVPNGILTHDAISLCTSNLTQLPDNKAFVFSRLHINKMDLRDISVLSSYKYFQYIDLSWNFISDLNPLNNCDYLMYLNASHNKITKVLDFRPPWFLTHISLCCNEIRSIGENLTNFWSLCHLDLSYNLIEKIEGLHNLKYLRYLNLSHNHITEIENLDCENLEELNISYNKLSGFDTEDLPLHNLKELRDLNIAHNFLSTLLHFQDIISLKKLDVSDNNLTQYFDIDCISGFKNLSDLNMTGNPVCASTGYREFLIFRVSSLDCLDSIPVQCSERVAARMLWEPDMFTRTAHLRTKIEFWKQLASQVIDVDTVPCDEPPIPLLVLVGTFANNKEEVAKGLELKFPDQVYRCKKYTTLPSSKNYDEDNLIPISMDEFNVMIKTGKFAFYYKEIGCFFGVGVEELCVCVTENKIGIIEAPFEAGMVLKSLGFHPFMVLCVLEDINNYEEKLRVFFTESDLWNRYCPPVPKKRASSHYTNLQESREGTDQEQYSGQHTTSFNFTRSEDLTFQSVPSKFLSYRSLHFSMFSDLPEFHRKTIRFSEDCDKKSTREESVRPSQSCFEDEDDDFNWTWSVETSISSFDEPSESYLNMLRGRNVFVQNAVEQQDMYIDLNNAQPSLFTATVYTDDVDSAVKTVGKTCCNIFNNIKNYPRPENLLEDPVCEKFVEERVKFLMNDLVNIPTDI